MKIEDKFKQAIEKYCGEKIDSIEVTEDNNVPNTYAIRSKHIDGEYLYWLVVRYTDSLTIDQIADKLEEVEFKEWPPTYGEYRYF